jgi:hypothetical protein
LGIGRSLGFTVSQGVVHNGPIAAGGTSAQLDTLTSWLCDVVVRDVIQLISFGQVIDDIPGCADLFNRAILSGITSAPAQAMKTCAPSAYAHSQQLSAVTVGLFFVVIVLVGIVLLALDYIGCEAFRIGFKAFWDVLLIVPAAAAAMFPGPTRSFAKKAAMRMLVHGAEMVAATAGLGILVLLMAQATRGTLPGTIGMTSPLAKLLVMLLISVFGAIGFRHLMRVFGDAGIPGPIRAGRFALNTAFRTGRTLEGIDYTGRKIKDVRSRLRNRNANKESGQGQSETGSVGQKAPGRKAHPPPSSTRPPSRPTGGTAPTRPGPAGPGPGRGPGGTSASAPGRTAAPPPPTGASTAAAGSRAAAATGAARGAARGAATVLAPEVALPVAAGAAAAARVGGAIRGHSSHSNGAPNPPGRSAPRPHTQPPPAAPAPQNPSHRAAEPERGDDAPRRSPPPGRTPPRPDQ